MSDSPRESNLPHSGSTRSMAIGLDGGTASEPKTEPTESHARDAHSNGRVNHLGYRAWSETLASGLTRWWVVAEVGVRRSWQNRWLRRMMLFAWLPAFVFGFGFFAHEQAAIHPEWRNALRPFVRGIPPTAEMAAIRDAVENGRMDESRHGVWGWLLLSFFRYPQAMLMVMVMGTISPPLISQDIRSRAFLLYFSRPLTRLEYLIGKMASLWVYLSIISTLPALSIYLLGVLLSPNFSVVSATWDLPFRILGASMVLMLPTSALALCFSSLTQESRYATFAWFAVWILGWFTYAAATSADAFEARREMRRRNFEARQFQRPIEPEFVDFRESGWTHLSLYHTLGRVQRWVFGFAKIGDVLTSIAILVVVTLLSLGTLYHRVSAPMRQ